MDTVREGTARKRSWRNVCPACGDGGTTQPGTPRRAALAGGGRAGPAGRHRAPARRAGPGTACRRATGGGCGAGRRHRLNGLGETTAERPPRPPSRWALIPYARRRRATLTPVSVARSRRRFHGWHHPPTVCSTRSSHLACADLIDPPLPRTETSVTRCNKVSSPGFRIQPRSLSCPSQRPVGNPPDPVVVPGVANTAFPSAIPVNLSRPRDSGSRSGRSCSAGRPASAPDRSGSAAAGRTCGTSRPS